MKTNIQIKIYFKYLFTSIFLISNETIFYKLVKIIIHHSIKMTQRTNNNIFYIDLISFELQYILDGDKKIFMAITFNFYIVVNKSYLYNYNEKITI